MEWFEAVQHAPHVHAPVTYLFGPFALLALLRWRRREARMLLLLACVPQTFVEYEMLPLYLVPETLREMVTLLCTTMCAMYAVRVLGGQSPGTLAEGIASRAPFWIAGVYLPALVIILRRPNVGFAPAWLDRKLLNAPAWLRGTPPTSDS
jgi:hypothetical protein